MSRILIIQTAFIGDAILILPMLEKLRESYSSSVIDVVCIPSTKEIFLASPAVNEVILLEKHGKHKSFRELLSFINEIKAKKYDKIYSPHRSLRTSLIVLLSGVPETTGFSNSALKYAYSEIIEYRYDVHEVQRNLDLISYDGDDWRIHPKLNFTDVVKNKILDYLNANNIREGFITISPGSVWPTKRYPFEYFIDIINFLLGKGRQVVLIGGEADSKITGLIMKHFTSNVFDSAGQFSLLESIELVKNSELLITNDSAPTHFGMCANVKTLTIYCSTIPEFGFYPYNKMSRFLSYNDLYCKPCGIHGYNVCPVKTFDCGKKLAPESVIEIINKMIF